MPIRDRIKSLRRVKASELVPNPKNYRTHPKAQSDAMRAALEEIGYADVLIARELPDGKLELLDGHLRREITPDEKVPVIILDVDEAEADKLLATLDPLTAMATVDDGKLAELAASITFDSDVLRDLVSSMVVTVPEFEPASAESQSNLGTEKVHQCPECGHEFSY